MVTSARSCRRDQGEKQTHHTHHGPGHEREKRKGVKKEKMWGGLGAGELELTLSATVAFCKLLYQIGWLLSRLTYVILYKSSCKKVDYVQVLFQSNSYLLLESAAISVFAKLVVPGPKPRRGSEWG